MCPAGVRNQRGGSRLQMRNLLTDQQRPLGAIGKGISDGQFFSFDKHSPSNQSNFVVFIKTVRYIVLSIYPFSMIPAIA